MIQRMVLDEGWESRAQRLCAAPVFWVVAIDEPRGCEVG